MASASDFAAQELAAMRRERLSIYASMDRRADRQQGAISTEDRSQRQFLFKVREAELRASRDLAAANAKKYQVLDQARAKRAAFAAAIAGQPFDPDTMDPAGYDLGAKAVGRGADRDARAAIAAARDADRDADRALRADRDADLRGYRGARLDDADLDRDLRDRGLAALKDYRDNLLEDRDLDRAQRDARGAASAAGRADRDAERSLLNQIRRIEWDMAERRKLYYVDGKLDQNALFGDAQYQRLTRLRAGLMAALLDGGPEDSEAPTPPAGGGDTSTTGGSGAVPGGGAMYGWILPAGTPGHESGTDLAYTSTDTPPVPGAKPWPPREAATPSKKEVAVPITGGNYKPWDEMRGEYRVDQQAAPTRWQDDPEAIRIRDDASLTAEGKRAALEALKRKYQR